MITPTERPVAVIGLGNMGYGSAASLLRAGIAVRGCDLDAGRRASLEGEGAETFASVAEAAEGCRAAFLFVINADQAERVLFGNGHGEGGVVAALPEAAIVV
ncbi:MAG TPA: NAD(P)-binding domain-containing protein, partial [Afifellaceae bacterium]|nr:NAD(P)-binding domain-containing protein [Afifellaceae bacterium]